ncbi:MAG: prolyl oligopeptidase family serine peptidase [Gemmataceae bacterium]
MNRDLVSKTVSQTVSLIVSLTVLLGIMSPLWAQGTKADYERSAALRTKFAGKVFRDKVEPHWFANGDRFWYDVKTTSGKVETILVDAVNGTKTVITKDKLPKDALTDTKPTTPPSTSFRGRRSASNKSPDERWQVEVDDHNLVLVNLTSNVKTKLTSDGTAADGYNGFVLWAPNSSRFIAIRFKPGGDRKVTYVDSSPRDQVQPKVTTSRTYLKPGDEIPQESPRLFDPFSAREISVSTNLFPNPWGITNLQWSPDSKRFRFVYNQRGHQINRVIEIDGATGATTSLVNEECPTFFDYSNKTFLKLLDRTNDLIWMSERSGWNHLYRIDQATSAVKNPITSGNWVVRGVESVNEETQQIWFRAMGLDANQDPYHIHYCRVNFDGSGFTRLTEGDGTHTLQWSPDWRFYIDTYSRVDSPPTVELRRGLDGKKVLTLEEAQISELRESGWQTPERFVAKGRDGKTDIHGIILRPTNFDPQKKYPVIEYIYAGPHDHHVPKSFRPFYRTMEMAELGFIVVQMDGMGTNWRSKAFHDHCWKNIGDAGFPDRQLWIKAAAARYPQLDISRGVGIYGGSAGGQNTVRGMTEYPDFYTVGVADCGCHDNRMDKIWWNEAWMGWPVGPHYKEQSNVTNAHKIKGHLFLTVGELDTNVDPASTMQVANALIKANVDYDLLVVPGANHGAGETPYADRRRKDFFVRHLLGVEPRAK